jgi:hypothetical protein
MIQPGDAVMHASAFPATVAVVDEYFLENWRKVIVYEMMNDTVPEIRRKYFTLHRPFNDEANAGFRFVSPFPQLIKHGKYFRFKSSFESKGAEGVPLVPPGVEIGAEQFVQDLLILIAVEIGRFHGEIGMAALQDRHAPLTGLNP